jgi:S-layer protein (TIGR01564 family)
MPKVADSDTYVGIDLDDWGMIATYDNENKDTLDVKYPEERVIADVWIAPSGASATAATSGAVNVNYINAATGVARTDADFASAVPTKNVILIGGPSVNELVKDLADANKTQAASAYAADSAIVQLVADAFGSNDALVIAGYASKDTKLAGQVVAANLLQGQFSDKMTGSKVTINTAGATTVSGVSFA